MKNSSARKLRQVPAGYLVVGVDPHKKTHAAVTMTQDFITHSKFKFNNSKEGFKIALEGSFENLPTDMNELLEHYPEIITKGKPNQYSIRDTGELDITVGTDHTAKLPAKTIFHANASLVIGEENAGIIGLSGATLSDK